jgi:hypothetical protein
MVKSSQFSMVPQTNPMNQDEGFAQGGFCVNGERENRRTCMTHPPNSEKLVVLYLPALSNSRRWRERKRMPLEFFFLSGRFEKCFFWWVGHPQSKTSRRPAERRKVQEVAEQL